MVENQIEKPSTRLLKHIIKCYYRLSENRKASMALIKNLPFIVKSMSEHNNVIYGNIDESSKKLLQSLIEKLCPSSYEDEAGDITSDTSKP